MALAQQLMSPDLDELRYPAGVVTTCRSELSLTGLLSLCCKNIEC